MSLFASPYLPMIFPSQRTPFLCLYDLLLDNSSKFTSSLFLAFICPGREFRINLDVDMELETKDEFVIVVVRNIDEIVERLGNYAMRVGFEKGKERKRKRSEKKETKKKEKEKKEKDQEK